MTTSTTLTANSSNSSSNPNVPPPTRSPLKWNWSVLKLCQNHFLAYFITLSNFEEYSSLGFCVHLDCDSYETALRQARWMLACGAVRLLVAPPDSKESVLLKIHQNFVDEVAAETWRLLAKQRWQHFLSAVARYTLPKASRYEEATKRFFTVLEYEELLLQQHLASLKNLLSFSSPSSPALNLQNRNSLSNNNNSVNNNNNNNNNNEFETPPTSQTAFSGGNQNNEKQTRF